MRSYAAADRVSPIGGSLSCKSSLTEREALHMLSAAAIPAGMWAAIDQDPDGVISPHAACSAMREGRRRSGAAPSPPRSRPRACRARSRRRRSRSNESTAQSPRDCHGPRRLGSREPPSRAARDRSSRETQSAVGPRPVASEARWTPSRMARAKADRQGDAGLVASIAGSREKTRVRRCPPSASAAFPRCRSLPYRTPGADPIEASKGQVRPSLITQKATWLQLFRLRAISGWLMRQPPGRAAPQGRSCRAGLRMPQDQWGSAGASEAAGRPSNALYDAPGTSALGALPHAG